MNNPDAETAPDAPAASDAKANIERLIEIMAALRTPGSGCPWDLEQTFRTIAPYTIEEAYEVLDAVERDDMDDLKDELGDLLLQVVFHARMAEERGAFEFADVATAISNKMIRRHPHVFASGDAATPGAVKVKWEDIKAEEKRERHERRLKQSGNSTGSEESSLLADVPDALPALMRAEKLQKRAARVGFDWSDSAQIIEKIREELTEVETALAGSSADGTSLEDEIGDLLFSVVNLARFKGLDSENIMRHANTKFECRFNYIEREIKSNNEDISDAGIDRMQALWNAAKATGL